VAAHLIPPDQKCRSITFGAVLEGGVGENIRPRGLRLRCADIKLLINPNSDYLSSHPRLTLSRKGKGIRSTQGEQFAGRCMGGDLSGALNRTWLEKEESLRSSQGSSPRELRGKRFTGIPSRTRRRPLHPRSAPGFSTIKGANARRLRRKGVRGGA